MKIMVLGGDGFCGWPSALRLASEGHEVVIVDNLSRRAIGEALPAPSLTPIRPIEERIKAARKIGDVRFEMCDIARDCDGFRKLLRDIAPDTVVHFAEQRSAPYSMLGHTERAYTVENNISTNNNLLSLLVELDQRPHIVHLGTMGVYGYNDDFGEIPEGYLDIEVLQTQKRVTIPYPGNPGSIYHLTKVLDHQLMRFYAKNWAFPITDLHQGVVWGTETALTRQDPALMNRFDYDGEYGTVLNRMIAQSQIDYPLTVYGTGGQSRAFIHIQDTAQCISLACANPPEPGTQPHVFNQIAEVLTVRDLATMLSEKTGVAVNYMENPRKELAENRLSVSNEGLRSLGFKPITLNENLIHEIEETAGRYKDRLNRDIVLSKARW